MIVSFKTLGCRLNQAEEESLRHQFLEAGFFVSEPKNADICIVNTCSVTDLADKKSHGVIKKLKIENNELKIVAIGCGAEKAKEYPEVDLWIENKDKKNTLKILNSKFQILNQCQNSKSKIITKHNKRIENSFRTRALLKVQDGCSNFCSYCIVPFLRGREASVPLEAIIKEAQKLEGMGHKELVISGVNVGKYQDNFQFSIFNFQKGESAKLIDLLKTIIKATNFPRIRLSSINPQDVSDEMIDLWAKEPRLCRHFHLSLQSGSDSVLKRMGRPYSVQQYYSLVKKITQKIPEIAITTDIIVGFTGETEREFEETFEFAQKVKFAKIHVFRYSKRDGTKAALMSDQVSEKLKKIRAQKLQRLANKLRKEFVERFIGSNTEVLFESQKDGFWHGLTSNYIKVRVKTNEKLSNEILKIKLESYDSDSDKLIGQIY